MSHRLSFLHHPSFVVPCYVSMARIARLEWVLDDGRLGARICSELVA
jgi:hypothetical protein